ncbi:MAG: NAD(P)-binding protein [Nitrospirae bacterium]|nr:NAD(P)-binding protein [Nitrospirota bacterium]
MTKPFKYAVRSDAVIIGSGLSGLVAGALLSKSGKKVVILPEENPAASVEVPFFPQTIGLGFEREGPVDRIFNEIGISIPLLRRTQEVFKKKSSFLQILLSFYRFTLYHDRENTLDDLKTGFGGKVQTLRVLFQKSDEWEAILYPFLYSTSPWAFIRKGAVLKQLTRGFVYQAKVFKLQTQKALEFCKALGMEEDPIDFLNALSLFYFHHTLRDISTLDFFKMLLVLKNEPLMVSGGISGLREIFLKVIKENKGEIWSTPPSSLSFQKNRILGVEFKGKESLGCDVLILNPEKGGLAKEKAVRIFNGYFEIPEEVIPAMMGDCLILKFNDRFPYHSGNFLMFSLATGETAGSMEEKRFTSKRAVLAQYFLPASKNQVSEEELKKEIEQRLIWVMPFVEGKIEWIKSFVEEQKEWNFPYLSKEKLRKAAFLQKGNYPVLSMDKSFYFLPHPVSDVLINPFLIKRGYDVAHIVKKRGINP